MKAYQIRVFGWREGQELPFFVQKFYVRKFPSLEAAYGTARIYERSIKDKCEKTKTVIWFESEPEDDHLKFIAH